MSRAVGLNVDTAKVAALVQENSAKALPKAELKARIQAAVSENDYDGVILSLVKKYCPPGMLGLALTAPSRLVHVGDGRERHRLLHRLDV